MQLDWKTKSFWHKGFWGLGFSTLLLYLLCLAFGFGIWDLQHRFLNDEKSAI